MCGIAGFFHFDQEREVSYEVLKRMTDVIAHRGPDGEGFYQNGNIALGHRRLAIIDLDSGEQPMYSEDGKIVIVFNGEIYNYLELREELGLSGARFKTSSDTEVIIQAYRTWGIDCLSHFNGMWAFALWDDHLHRLFVSRDRIGEKPLYYTQSDDSFVFGSEIKSVLKYGITAEPRLDTLELYLTLSYVPSPYTFYKDIYQLMPGQYLLADSQGCEIKTYWELPDITESDLRKDKKSIEQEFSELFHDAVNIRMRSDVAFGAFLSGGLDSSCVVSTMAQCTSRPLQTFTMKFNNPEFDESSLALLVSEKFGTDHHVGLVTEEHFNDALDKVLFHYDEPFGDSSAIPTGHVSKYAAEFVKMVLTGDGGDEVLSGYTTYQGEKFAKQYEIVPSWVRQYLPVLMKWAAKPLRGKARYKLNRVIKVLHSSNLPFEKRLRTKLSTVAPQDLEEIIPSNLPRMSFMDFYYDTMRSCRFKDPFYKLMYFQHKVSLPDDMLTKVDRMSMAYSIETRIPFLDFRIVELLYRAHKDLKIKGYVNKTILRNSVANKSLPKELLTAPKRGFRVPLRDWFKKENLNSTIHDILFTKNMQPLYDTARVTKLVRQNRNGEIDAGNFIWMLLVLSKWMNGIKKPHPLTFTNDYMP